MSILLFTIKIVFCAALLQLIQIGIKNINLSTEKNRSRKYAYLYKLFLTVLTVTSLSAYATEKLPKNSCFDRKEHNYSEVLNCYREAQEKLPLMYSTKSILKEGSLEKRTYELISQSWMPGESTTPKEWTHTVEIYIPDNALSTRAILIINNGINIGFDKNLPKKPTDYSDEMLQSLATKTRTITISVSNVPNQYLKFDGDATPKREDDSVAYSWKLFLDAPDKHVFSSLHIPMMEAAVKAMDLAENELKQFNVHRFIVAGTSKRAWTSWHTALVDSRVDAIVPFVIDILNTKKVLMHEYQTFGKSWPIAFTPYFREGITEKLATTDFEKLMKIEDPLEYLHSAYAKRLAIPKYIVNASSDSFFTPDNAQFYFNQLPGINLLRVVPNSDHYGISKFTESSLVPFVNRFQQSVPFPILTTSTSRVESKTILHVIFSEFPVEVLQWTATNSNARDFRYPCGIRYVSTVVKFDGKSDTTVIIDHPKTGWTATYLEARFKDGLVGTSPVIISPEEKYPHQPVPSAQPFCKTVS